MAYTVNTFDEVEDYLYRVPDMSPEARERVIAAYLHDLAEHADEFLRRTPLAHESYTFEYQYVLKDGEYLFGFRFIVDAAGMPYGVVQVLYVDCERSAIHRLEQ